MIFEERQIEKNNFSSRAMLLFGIVSLGFLAVLLKVFSLQISGYTDYQLAALKNKNYAVPVQALRGDDDASPCRSVRHDCRRSGG